MEHTQIAWLRYIADGTDVKAIRMLEKLVTLSRHASPFTSVATANVELPEKRSLSSFVIPSVEED